MSQDNSLDALLGRLIQPALVVCADGVIAGVNDAMRSFAGEAWRPRESIFAGIEDATDLARLIEAGAGACDVQLKISARFVCMTVAAREDGGVLLTANDVTTYRTRVERMQDELQRYLDMVGSAGDLFHELPKDPGDVISLYFPRSENGRTTVLEQRVRFPDDCVDPLFDPEGVAEWLAGLIDPKPYRDRFHRVPTADGSERYYKASAVPYFDKAGNFAGFRGVSTEVTAHVIAERALKESEARLRRNRHHLAQAQRIAAVASTERDIRSGAEEWSDEMYRLIGVDPETFVRTNASVMALIHPDDREAASIAIVSAHRGIRPTPGEFRVVRPDGEIRTLYCETDIVKGEDGRPQRVLTIYKDVTELRARIAELEAARGQLEVQQAQLRESAAALAVARDDAEAASRSKSTFLAHMSHELRTPLNAIIGFSQVMREEMFGPLLPRYRGYAVDILNSGEHLLHLINGILDLSKIEAGKAELHETVLDPREAIAACTRLIRERADATGIALAVRADGALPQVRVDELKFKQVLINLLANAVKFTPRGGKIDVTATATRAGLQIEVRDTGVGMKAEDIPLALQPFRQVGEHVAGREQGTGLGLPLAKAFIELHRGSIAIESECGRGTTVRVVIPKSRFVAKTRARAS